MAAAIFHKLIAICCYLQIEMAWKGETFLRVCVCAAVMSVNKLICVKELFLIFCRVFTKISYLRAQQVIRRAFHKMTNTHYDDLSFFSLANDIKVIITIKIETISTSLSLLLWWRSAADNNMLDVFPKHI